MAPFARGRGRPKRRRQVGFQLRSEYFRPEGAFSSDLHERVITMEELEALRLVDLNGLEQEEAAVEMDISRKTIWRELKSARSKIADALVHGKGIRISGGHYEKKMPKRGGTGPDGEGPRTGRGMGNCSPSRDNAGTGTALVSGGDKGAGRQRIAGSGARRGRQGRGARGL